MSRADEVEDRLKVFSVPESFSKGVGAMDERWHDSRPTGIGLVISVGTVNVGEIIL